MIVIAVAAPRSWRDVLRVHELPIRHVGGLQTKIIPHRGRNIEARAMIQIRFWTFVAEHVLKMISAERTAIFPLRVTGGGPFANGDPMMPANRLSLAGVRLLEPRDHQRRFRFELAVRYIVVRQREIKWILSRNKRDRNVIAAV